MEIPAAAAISLMPIDFDGVSRMDGKHCTGLVVLGPVIVGDFSSRSAHVYELTNGEIKPFLFWPDIDPQFESAVYVSFRRRLRLLTIPRTGPGTRLRLRTRKTS